MGGDVRRASRILGSFRDVTRAPPPWPSAVRIADAPGVKPGPGGLAVRPGHRRVRGPDLNASWASRRLPADRRRRPQLLHAGRTGPDPRDHRRGLCARRPPGKAQYRFRRMDGRCAGSDARRPAAERRGPARASVGVAMDITDRKEAQGASTSWRARSIRANNLLAVIQSLVQLSKGETPRPAPRAGGRITALGRAHKLCRRRAGPARPAPVVEELLLRPRRAHASPSAARTWRSPRRPGPGHGASRTGHQRFQIRRALLPGGWTSIGRAARRPDHPGPRSAARR
jgi:hypothetical protein